MFGCSGMWLDGFCLHPFYYIDFDLFSWIKNSRFYVLKVRGFDSYLEQIEFAYPNLYRFQNVRIFSGMMFIFMSLLELAVVGFMSRNDGSPRLTTRSKKSSYAVEEFTWKEMPSPRIGLRQYWVDKRCSSIKTDVSWLNSQKF